MAKDITNEIGKHKKKKASTISKSKNKSTHKHQYADCLLNDRNTYNGEEHSHICKAKYCVICGKINDIHYFQTTPHPTKPCCRIMLTNEELLELYPNVPIYDIDPLQSKYVPI